MNLFIYLFEQPSIYFYLLLLLAHLCSHLMLVLDWGEEPIKIKLFLYLDDFVNCVNLLPHLQDTLPISTLAGSNYSTCNFSERRL